MQFRVSYMTSNSPTHSRSLVGHRPSWKQVQRCGSTTCVEQELLAWRFILRLPVGNHQDTSSPNPNPFDFSVWQGFTPPVEMSFPSFREIEFQSGSTAPRCSAFGWSLHPIWLSPGKEENVQSGSRSTLKCCQTWHQSTPTVIGGRWKKVSNQ